MRGFPDRQCPDCGENNGAHRTDCAGRVACQECGGKYRAHQTYCSKLYAINKQAPAQRFRVPDSVKVSDLASPFHNWHGKVTYVKVKLSNPSVISSVCDWYYECAIVQRDHVLGAGSGASLTFHQDQLQEDA